MVKNSNYLFYHSVLRICIQEIRAGSGTQVLRQRYKKFTVKTVQHFFSKKLSIFPHYVQALQTENSTQQNMKIPLSLLLLGSVGHSWICLDPRFNPPTKNTFKRSYEKAACR
jgi:hypothetical protein